MVSTFPELSSPQICEAAFYRALRDLDLNLMRRVWSESPEVYCIHPGGQLLNGFQDVESSWIEIFSSADPPMIEEKLLHYRSGGDLAVHLVEEWIRPAGSQARATKVLATNMYIREQTGWRMLCHHASLPLMPRSSSKLQQKMH